MSEQLYRLTITATGEVRDAEGNLLNQQPLEAEITLTEEQAAALVANQEETP